MFVLTTAYLCVISLSRNLFISFSLKFCKSRNRKNWQSWIFHKNLDPRWKGSKMDPVYGVFLSFQNMFALLFAGSNLKRILQFSYTKDLIFMCKPNIWENYASQGQIALVQSGCRILWSSISLEGLDQYFDIFDFLHGDIRQVASESIAFGWVYPGIYSHAQTCLDLMRVPLVGLEVYPD